MSKPGRPPAQPADAERLRKLERLAALQRSYSLFFYKPYPKQAEFHALGVDKRERILMAGNQLGKTWCASYEATFHATGIYPDWWVGRRFERPNRAWVSNRTAELTRDGPQRYLLGQIGSWGTGTIPQDKIIDIRKARGIAEAAELILIRHIHGGVSQIVFKAYKDGREAWQTETLDWIWLDEEPPIDIYTEALARTTATHGPLFMTFTPMLGMSDVVARFWPNPLPHCGYATLGIEDALHIAASKREEEIAKYPEHEREARVYGMPMLGSGRIFPIAEEVLREDDLAEIPEHWKRLNGIDFGWEHHTAAVQLAYDVDADCIHLVRAYRQKKQIPLIHAAAIKPWGDWVPTAWPHDALQHDKGSGAQLKDLYSKSGLVMLAERAQFPDDRGNGVEAGLIELLQRMQTGRFRVAASLSEWWEEFRGYHRKDGKVVKERDDLMDATRYATMMLRYALAFALRPQRPDRYAQSRHRQGNVTWMSQ